MEVIMKRYFIAVVLIVTISFTFACDTSKNDEPYGEWSYFNNYHGILYEQMLVLSSDGSYSWDYFEDEIRNDENSSAGKFSISSKKGSFEITFVPDSETMESFMRNFMVTGGGNSLFIAEKSNSGFTGLTFLKQELGPQNKEVVANE